MRTKLKLCSPQILAALGRKVTFAPSLDLGALAGKTDGFSGADLQALVYNAHLEVVHDAISALPPDASAKAHNGAGESATDVQYTVLGGQAGDGRVMSRAEESAFQRRVRICLHASPQRDALSTAWVPLTAAAHPGWAVVEGAASAVECDRHCGGVEGAHGE